MIRWRRRPTWIVDDTGELLNLAQARAVIVVENKVAISWAHTTTLEDKGHVVIRTCADRETAVAMRDRLARQLRAFR